MPSSCFRRIFLNKVTLTHCNLCMYSTVHIILIYARIQVMFIYQKYECMHVQRLTNRRIQSTAVAWTSSSSRPRRAHRADDARQLPPLLADENEEGAIEKSLFQKNTIVLVTSADSSWHYHYIPVLSILIVTSIHTCVYT